MIYVGATAVAWPAFDGAAGGLTSDDEVMVVVGNDPVVLENRVNAEGIRQAGISRDLIGIQLCGSGRGQIFTVQLVFNSAAVVGLYDMTFAAADEQTDGIRVFLFSGDSERELAHRQQDALARARAFVSGFDLAQWRGVEIAGASDGKTVMGMFVIYRGTE